MGIVDRISALSGTEAAKALNFAHDTFQTRHGEHGHSARALIETIAEVCRNHPNLVGVGAGLLVEQFLVHEKHVHDEHRSAGIGAPVGTVHTGSTHDGMHEGVHLPHVALPHFEAPHLPHVSVPTIRLDQIRPGKIAMEVFGALVLLKFSRGVARALRRNHADPWFAPAARIRLFSGSIAAYYLAKSLKARKVSAWRNAAVALFGTDAIKPLLKPRPPGAQLTLRPPQPRAPTPAPAPPPPERPPGPDLMASAAP